MFPELQAYLQKWTMALLQSPFRPRFEEKYGALSFVNAELELKSFSEEIIGEAKAQAAQIKEKASADIAQEKKKALNEAKDEISGIAMSIAEKVVERQLDAADQEKLVSQFIDNLGGAL